MRKSSLLALLLVWLSTAVGVSVAPQDARASYHGGPGVALSVSYFYDALGPYGGWVDDPSYGWCWIPSRLPVGWRPYSDGYWAYTDYGWTWVASEPWGWAAFHYGRWIYDPFYGWMWVPGTVWAPAWVAWRSGDDWCAWAPLPPQGAWQTSFSVSFSTESVRRIPTDRWCFVPTRYLCDRNVRYRIVSPGRNVGLIGHTWDATRYRVRDGRLVDEGISAASFERRTGRQVPRLQVVEARSPWRGQGQRVGRDQISFYQPRLRPAPGSEPAQRQQISRRERDQWSDHQRQSRPVEAWRSPEPRRGGPSGVEGRHEIQPYDRRAIAEPRSQERRDRSDGRWNSDQVRSDRDEARPSREQIRPNRNDARPYREASRPQLTERRPVDRTAGEPRDRQQARVERTPRLEGQGKSNESQRGSRGRARAPDDKSARNDRRDSGTP